MFDNLLKMDSFSLLLALLCTAAVAIISQIALGRRHRRARNLPPGPKPWPIIGNLNLIGSLPHRSLHHLSQKYGELMLLKFGKFPVLIASSPKMAEQFLKAHDAVFASRPALAKGTTVIVNPWSIQRDPNSWDSPEEFLPERFMGREIDVTGSNFTILPFGSGRRGCIGYNLALKIVGTTLANLLHGFEVKLVEGMRPRDISMEEEYGLSTHPKHPLSIILKPTLPPNLY